MSPIAASTGRLERDKITSQSLLRYRRRGGKTFEKFRFSRKRFVVFVNSQVCKVSLKVACITLSYLFYRAGEKLSAIRACQVEWCVGEARPAGRRA